MTWRSAIHDMPDVQYLETFESDSRAYEEWVEKMTLEPWFVALENLVKWTGTWVGTEQQLVEELQLRVGREVFASPDFPTSLKQLSEYMEFARDAFCMRYLGFLHYDELTEEDLDDFDVPRWSPEVPILVFEGRAAHPPDYWSMHVKLLKFWHPLPLAILRLTASRQFTNSPDFEHSRKRTYTTRELAKALAKHYPRYDNVPKGFADAARPEGVDHLLPEFKSLAEFSAMTEPYGREDHLYFHRQIRKWAPILKEVARIKISSQKHTCFPGAPESIADRPARTFWTIQAPRYKDRDLFGNMVWLTWSDCLGTPGGAG